MELKEVIAKRRSIRRYQTLDVKDELIKEILESARIAPSAKNRQPWRFIILKDKQKDTIADIMLKWDEANKTFRDQTGTVYKNSVLPTALVMKQASVLIMVYKKSDSPNINSDVLSIGAAVENICLTATDLGLGSLWICDVMYVKDEINEYLKITDMDLSTVVAIGYAAEEPIPRPRLSYEEIVIQD